MLNSFAVPALLLAQPQPPQPPAWTWMALVPLLLSIAILYFLFLLIRRARRQYGGMAIASLFCGVFGILALFFHRYVFSVGPFFFYVGPFLAVVLGHVARSAIRRSGGHPKGAGIALAGVILGYSWVPLAVMIVMIDIPRLFAGAKNEASAIGGLRRLNILLEDWRSSEKGFPSSLTELVTPSTISYDRMLASGALEGYSLAYVPIDTNGDGYVEDYRINADPVQPGKTGNRFFFTDSSRVIRAERSGPARANSPPLRPPGR